MVFFMNIYAIIKELVQISQQVTSTHIQNSSQILKITEKLNQSYPFTLNDAITANASTSDEWAFAFVKGDILPFLLICSFPLLHLKRSSYFKDYSNGSDWSSAILSLLFVVPLMLNVEGTFHWQAGALAGLNCWMGFLLFLQRCPHHDWTNVILKNLQRTGGMLTDVVFFYVSVCVSQVWGYWHLCCDVYGDLKDAVPGRVALLLPDVCIQFGFLRSDAEPGRQGRLALMIVGMPMYTLKLMLVS